MICLKYLLASFNVENFYFSGLGMLNAPMIREKIFDEKLVNLLTSNIFSDCIEIRINSLICVTLLLKHSEATAIYLIKNNLINELQVLLQSTNTDILLLVSWMVATLSAVTLQQFMILGNQRYLVSYTCLYRRILTYIEK